MTIMLRSIALLAALFCAFFDIALAASDGEKDLIGLWRAKRVFGPDIQGVLTIAETKDGLIADINGWRIKLLNDDEKLHFSIQAEPEGKTLGTFSGAFDKRRRSISGHWKQPTLVGVGNPFATPVKLTRQDNGTWVGVIDPYTDAFTLFLNIFEKENGDVGVFLRNPERNEGVFVDLETLKRNGNDISYVGKFFGRGESYVMRTGRYFAEQDRLTMNFQNRGGIYAFERVSDDESSEFYARSKNPKPYKYSVPLARDDGWDTASLSDVGMTFESIKQLIEMHIQKPAQDVHASYIHSVLVARHGKLVFEGYFHGFDRDTPHDTRSASKSLTSTLIGAAIEADYPISLSTPVYETMYGDDLPENLDPRKKQMTVEHLLTMSSGHFCDDSNPNAPGNEEVMQEQQDEPDWYQYILNVPMVSEPGENGIYCSADANLAGGVLNRVSGVPLETLFDNLIAKPLQMGAYHLNLSPTGEPYMGGGIYWRPRDFLKLGQLMLDGGVWNGKRIISAQWAETASSPLIKVRDRDYGFFWWVHEYEYNGEPVRAFFAGGNGGNIVVVVPELDLVIAFFGGNYADRVLFRNQNEFVPEYIMPAVSKK